MASVAGDAFAATLRMRYMDTVESMLSLNARIDEKLKLLETKERQHSLVSFRSSVSETAREVGICLDENVKEIEEAERRHIESHNVLLPHLFPTLTEVPIRWDVSQCSEFLTISEGGRVVTKTKSSGSRSGVLATLPNIPSFQVCLGHVCGGSVSCLVGYRKGGDTMLERFSSACGWFLDVSTGNLFHNGEYRNYCPKLKSKQAVTVNWNRAACIISFMVDGINHGDAFDSVTRGCVALYPCVFITSGTFVKLLD